MANKNFKTDLKHFKNLERILIKKNKKYCKDYNDFPSHEEILLWLIDSYSTILTPYGRKCLVKNLKELIRDIK